MKNKEFSKKKYSYEDARFFGESKKLSLIFYYKIWLVGWGRAWVYLYKWGQGRASSFMQITYVEVANSETGSGQ